MSKNSKSAKDSARKPSLGRGLDALLGRKEKGSAGIDKGGRGVQLLPAARVTQALSLIHI
mgnify:CR=1 FL=1